MQYKVFKINLLSAESTYDIPEGWNPGKILYSSDETIIMMIEKYTPQQPAQDVGYTIPTGYTATYNPAAGIGTVNYATTATYNPGGGGTTGRLY